MTSPNNQLSAPLEIIIFGGAGDLSFRKLLPALYMAHLHDKLDPDVRILAVGRQNWSTNQYLDFIEQNSRPFIEPNALSDADWQDFKLRLNYVCLDVTSPPDFQRLQSVCHPQAPRVYYLATAPSLFTQICQSVSQAGLVNDQTRVVLEKPLGHDLASAQAIHNEVAKYFREDQIYRIDHYLGKETVQNLMVLRFGNAIFEPLWRAPFIKSVQITVAESVGVGSRAGFYDGTGAMRDMIQNHLLQLLCIVAMEQPISFDADDVRDEKLKVLRSLKKFTLDDVKRDTIRGQYAAGVVDGQTVHAYLQEKGVPADSQTETFVALRAQIHNARWANVPFFLRTGKRMAKRQSQIIIEFSSQLFSIFGQTPQQQPNRLIITLQPEESIQLEMMVKEPGTGMNIHPVKLGLDLQQSSDKRRAEAYERLLMDVIKGRLTHFMRRDELEAAWVWVETILNGWKASESNPHPYPAGSWGPSASSELMARNALIWYEAIQ